MSATSLPAATACLVLGLAIVLSVFSSILRTLVVPRGVPSRLSRGVLRATMAVFRTAARRAGSYAGRDRVLAYAAPLSLIVTLLTWLALLFVGYGLMLYAFSPLSWASALREAGSSLFTLGFASTDRGQLTVLDFLAALTGPLVVGLLVGYLPSIYASYNRREVEVAMLHSRAGEPNWGPELLGRFAVVATVEELPGLWREWERWAADVAESHVNYPVLTYVRSAQPLRNWLIALLAVMDSAALNLALNPQLPQGPARYALRQGFVAIRDIARSEGIEVTEDPDPHEPIDVTPEEFDRVCAMLATVGFSMGRTPQEAYPHFRGWRVNYERAAYALASRIDAVPAAWSGPRHPAQDTIYPRRPQNRTPADPGGSPGKATDPDGHGPDAPAPGN
ncbi:MAG: hypothetical protein ABI468_03100 [Candidatus Nanopelagicales bacterium]